MKNVDLASYNNSLYKPGGRLKIFLWYFFNIIFLKNGFQPFSWLKIFVLKMFGAKIGSNVTLKPGVNVKYPWKLTIGSNVWVGENVWVDNLDEVIIGDNVCLSQGVMLLSGNHNYKKSTFDLIIGKIILEDGVWIGSKSIVSGGITCHSHSVLSLGSVASKDLLGYTIYRGNPAIEVAKRVVSE